jgi:hypothetical protein
MPTALDRRTLTRSLKAAISPAPDRKLEVGQSGWFIDLPGVDLEPDVRAVLLVDERNAA